MSLLTSPTGFNGLNQTTIGGIAPPDVAVAAGPNHVMEIVNRQVAIYDKSGNQLSSVTLNSFFQTGTDWTFDSRVLYDSLSQHWFALTDDGTPGNVHIAVSNTADPTSWHFYAVGGTAIRCYDQPRIGVSADKIVVTADVLLYNPPPGPFLCNGGGTSYEQYWVLNKSDMVNGARSARNTTIANLRLQGLVPMQALTATNTIYMESTGISGLGNVTVVTINGVPPGTVTNTTTTIVPSAPGQTIPGQFTAPTPNANSVDLSDGTRMLSVVWSQGKLWSTYMVACTPPGDNTLRSCVQLLELNTTSTPSIIQNFDQATKGQYYFYPALSMDGLGNMDLIYGYSNSTTYPSLALSGQAFNDPQNTLASPLTIAQGSFLDNSGRYGDYFAAGPDPNDSGLVWLAGEYFKVSHAGGWSTFIASERFPVPIGFRSSVARSYNNAASGTAALQLIQDDVLVVGISIQGGYFGSVSSVTDNVGNSYSHAGTDTNSHFAIDIWTGLVTVGGTGTITVALSIPATRFVIAIAQYSGAQPIMSTSFNAGNCCTVIDTNQYHTVFGNQPGVHWGVGFGGAVGTATMSQNTGILRVSAVTSYGSGDVSGGIADVKGNPGSIGDPLISLSAPETSYGAMVELIPFGDSGVTLSNNPHSADWTILSGTWTQPGGAIDGYGNYPELKSTSSFAANRTVTLSAKTITSGPNSWNTAWIRAKYIDNNNKVTAFLRNDGYVELDYKQSGSTTYYVSAKSSGQSPTSWNSFVIVFAGNNIKVILDGTTYIDQPNSAFGTFGAANIVLTTSGPGNYEAQFDSVTIT